MCHETEKIETLKEQFYRAVAKWEEDQGSSMRENEVMGGILMDKTRIMGLVIDPSCLPSNYFKEPFKAITQRQFTVRELLHMETFVFGETKFTPHFVHLMCKVLGYKLELKVKAKDCPLIMTSKKGTCVIAPRISFET